MKPRSAPDERQLRLGFIMSRLLRRQPVTVELLQEEFGAGENERTLRADLTAISQLRTRRSRGALAPATSFFHEDQRAKDLPEKLDCAQGAATELDSSASIKAGAGSCVALTIAERMELGVSPALVTNSLSIAELAPYDAYFVPGNYNPNIHALVGLETAAAFKSKPCRQGLIGVSGIRVIDGPDAQIGLYVRHPDELPVLQAMVDSVAELLVIVTNVQKLGKGDPWQIATLQGLSAKLRVVLVTNQCDDWKRELGDRYQAARQTRNALRAFVEESKKLAFPFKFVEVPRKKSAR